MDEQVIKFLKQIGHRAKESWWIFLLSAVLVGSSFAIFSLFLDKKYISSEIISLKDEETFNTLLRGIVAPVGSQNTLKSAESYLLSEPILKRVSNRAGLIDDSSSHQEVLTALSYIKNGLNVEQNSNNSRIITISFTANTPENAQSMTKILSRELVTQVMEARTQTAELALQFIEQELTVTRDELSEAKDSLASFKEQHLYSLPEGFIEGTRDIFEIKRALVEDQAELTEVLKRLELLEASLSEYNPKLTNALNLQTQQERELAILQQRLTNNHPRVKALIAQMVVTNLEINALSVPSEESAEFARVEIASDLSNSLALNSDGQDLFLVSRQLQQQELISTKERLEVRIEEFSSILQSLEMNVQNIPEIEEVISIRQDRVDELNSEIDRLFERFQSAQHSIDISTLNTTAGFSILSEANLPNWAFFPIIENFFFAGVFFGIVIILFAIVISELVFGRIYDVDDVESILKCNSLGELPDLSMGNLK